MVPVGAVALHDVGAPAERRAGREEMKLIEV